MTKRQREQVVELLRCAADVRHDAVFRINGIIGAGGGATWPVQSLAHAAVNECDTGRYDEEVYQAELLEAAARVEEGSWP